MVGSLNTWYSLRITVARRTRRFGPLGAKRNGTNHGHLATPRPRPPLGRGRPVPQFVGLTREAIASGARSLNIGMHVPTVTAATRPAIVRRVGRQVRGGICQGGDTEGHSKGASGRVGGLGVRVPGPTPVRADRSRQVLAGYHDREKAELLARGFTEGFIIPSRGQGPTAGSKSQVHR